MNFDTNVYNRTIIHPLPDKRKGKTQKTAAILSVLRGIEQTMAEVVGVICEYDPFHAGHARQFALIREKLPDARIVCLMSGPFTQRGMPALYAPAVRARAALRAGADLVLELPSLFAVREAEHFALGGLTILQRLGFVTHLSFGCENENLSVLTEAASLLERPCEEFSASLKAHLQGGKSFAAAQGVALAERLANRRDLPPEKWLALLSAPNNILAISYLRALMRLKSHLQPLPVLRVGSYHAKALGGAGFPSATAVRAAILRGDLQSAEAACGYELPEQVLCPPGSLDAVLLLALRQRSKAELALLPDCSEGLENLLFAACREATDRAELLKKLKSKRYTYARLSRLCTYSLLGVTRTLQQDCPEPTHVRLLGFRKESEALLAELRNSHLPVIAKAADGPLDSPLFSLDIHAYDLWALGAKIPAGLMLRQPVQIV